MTAKYSTGFRNGLLADGAFSSIMDGFVLKLFTGTEPASADDALSSNTLLCVYSKGGTGEGLEMAPPSGGAVSKPSGDTWSATALATGTPTFFRWEDPLDDGTLSTTAVRVQGKVGLLSDNGAQLALSTLAVVAGAPLSIDAASVTMPVNG